MARRSAQLLAAGLAALALLGSQAWAGPQDSPLPKTPPVIDGHSWPEIPPPPCANGSDPGPIVDCGHHIRPPCCCVGYDAAIHCPNIWPELQPPRDRKPQPPKSVSAEPSSAAG